MNQGALYVWSASALVIGIVFGFWPELDLMLVSPFAWGREVVFAYRDSDILNWLRDGAMWAVIAIASAAAVAVLVKRFRPMAPMLLPGRAVAFLLVTLVLGPGLVVNGLLKEGWGRPRPGEVAAFGGTKEFVPWWDPRGTCEGNCSFASGEASAAFWTIAAAALAPPAWRGIAYTIAVSFGFAVGILRMAFGAHFFSDVFFCGLSHLRNDLGSPQTSLRDGRCA